MHTDRPKKVSNGLACDENGIWYGEYMNFQLRAAYQPVIRMDNDGERYLFGYEGLVRPYLDGVPISPGQLFGSARAQDTLFIECMCYAVHIRNFRQFANVGEKLFLNLNPNAYGTLECVVREIGFTIDAIRRHGINGHDVVFEIVETKEAEPAILAAIVNRFRNAGIGIALDDFGAEASNWRRYVRINPDIVKIDGEIYRLMAAEEKALHRLARMVAAFKKEGVKVLVEGIETESLLWTANSIGFDLFQGWHLGRPIETQTIKSQSPLSENETIGL